MTVISELYGTQRLHPEDSRRSHITLSRFAATLMAYAHWAHDIEQGEMLGEAVRATQPDREDLSSPLLLVAHYATVFGMAADNYAKTR